MCEALARGEKIPFDPTDATIYYVGPTPAKPGQVSDPQARQPVDVWMRMHRP